MVVPIRSFHDAWTRLAGRVPPHARQRLAADVAERVIGAGRASRFDPIIVVTDDVGVARWSADLGVPVVAAGIPGLDAAVEAAMEHLVDLGVGRAVVAHADLPLAGSFRSVIAVDDDVVIVADRHGDGTNVLSIPLRSGFRPSYGPGSSQRHREQAIELGLSVTVVIDDELSWDLDTPDDLDHERVRELLSIALSRR